jgi:phenylacetaldehyde dehydrogenase
LADLIEANLNEFAEIESIDNGKLFVHAQHVDLPASLDLLRYYAGWPTKIEGRTIQPSVFIPGPDGRPMEFFSYTLREPVGVCGQIIPWNFPLIMAMLKLAPALAAGCTCISSLPSRLRFRRCVWANWSSKPAFLQAWSTS